MWASKSVSTTEQVCYLKVEISLCAFSREDFGSVPFKYPPRDNALAVQVWLNDRRARFLVATEVTATTETQQADLRARMSTLQKSLHDPAPMSQHDEGLLQGELCEVMSRLREEVDQSNTQLPLAVPMRTRTYGVSMAVHHSVLVRVTSGITVAHHTPATQSAGYIVGATRTQQGEAGVEKRGARARYPSFVGDFAVGGLAGLPAGKWVYECRLIANGCASAELASSVKRASVAPTTMHAQWYCQQEDRHGGDEYEVQCREADCGGLCRIDEGYYECMECGHSFERDDHDGGKDKPNLDPAIIVQSPGWCKYAREENAILQYEYQQWKSKCSCIASSRGKHQRHCKLVLSAAGWCNAAMFCLSDGSGKSKQIRIRFYLSAFEETFGTEEYDDGVRTKKVLRVESEEMEETAKQQELHAKDTELQTDMVLCEHGATIGWARSRLFVGNEDKRLGVGDDQHSWGVTIPARAAMSGAPDPMPPTQARHNHAYREWTDGFLHPADSKDVGNPHRFSLHRSGDTMSCAVEISPSGEVLSMYYSRNGEWPDELCRAQAPFNSAESKSSADLATATMATERDSKDAHCGIVPAVSVSAAVRLELNFGERPFAQPVPAGFLPVHCLFQLHASDGVMTGVAQPFDYEPPSWLRIHEPRASSASALAEELRSPSHSTPPRFKTGAYVQVRASVGTPRNGWGGIGHWSVGEATRIFKSETDEWLVEVDFTELASASVWTGVASELEESTRERAVLSKERGDIKRRRDRGRAEARRVKHNGL
jgi:hypothetical protein